VLVFNAEHRLETGFGDGVMRDPNGMAIDTENRFLYVADTELDQILVYDATLISSCAGWVPPGRITRSPIRETSQSRLTSP